MKYIITLVLSILLGCSPAKKEADSVCRLNIGKEPQSLDPHRARDLASITLVKMLFEGLTRTNLEGKTELSLAESVAISEDRKTYTFCLKEALWSNGKAVTAEDFVYGWRRILSPKFPSSTAFQLYVLKNGKSAKEGKVSLEELGIKALDAKTLQVELTEPVPYFLELLSLPAFFPVLSGLDEQIPHWAEKKEQYVSNGPFAITEWKHEDHLVLQKNPTYWDAAQVHLKQLEFVMVEESVEYQMFEQKQLDWVGSPLSNLPIDLIGSLKKQGSLSSKEMLGTYFLRLNQNRFPLNNSLIRQALSLAVNREDLAFHVAQGGQLPAYHLVPPLFGLHHSLENQKDAKELFKQGLKELGLTLETFPKLKISYRGSDRTSLMVQAIQDQWRSILGINIDLEVIEGGVYYDRIGKLDYDISHGSWIADFNDPINFLEIFKFKDSGSNNTGWENKTYISLLNASAVAETEELRKETLSQAEEILMQEAPIIPLYHCSLLYQSGQRLQNVVLTPLGGIDFKWAERSGEKQ